MSQSNAKSIAAQRTQVFLRELGFRLKNLKEKIKNKKKIRE